MLRAADQVGRNAPLKVLLSQDTVGDATRMLADRRYVQNARAQRIHALTTQLHALAKVEQDIATRRQALDAARAQQKAQAATLQKDRSQQAATVAQLDDRYKQRAEREKAIGQDAKALEQLLANLRAAAAKAEAERRAAAKRAAAEAAAQARRGKADRPDRRQDTTQGRRQCTGPQGRRAQLAGVGQSAGALQCHLARWPHQ